MPAGNPVSIQWNGLLGMPFDLKFSHKSPMGGGGGGVSWTGLDWNTGLDYWTDLLKGNLTTKIGRLLNKSTLKQGGRTQTREEADLRTMVK